MKNLKKVLAFALVVCMMLSTIVSATAISATDFTDYTTIQNADQVAVLTELGIINGYPDESFKPERTVTRAEMAKMITVILNKGTEAAGNYDGAQVFSDVYADMWCKGYINYCNTLGIVVGMGDGTYKPNQGVTVVQTAKMLLVAMGYDPVVEGFEGANWEVNVSAIAAQAGLYNGVTANAAAECSRDNAALIIYNALVANTVDGYTNGKAVVGDKTMLGKYFNAVVVTGVVVANDYANLFGSSALYNAKHASTEIALIGTQYVDDDDAIDPGISFIKNGIQIDAAFPFEFTKSFYDEYGNNDNYVSQIFETYTSIDQVGQTVKVVAQLKDNYDLYYKNVASYPNFTFSGKVIGKVMDVDGCVVKEYDGEYALLDKTSLKKEGIVIDDTTRYFVNYSVAWEQFGSPSRYLALEGKYSNYTALGFYNPSLISTLTNKAYSVDGIFFNADGAYTKIVDVDGDGVAEMVLQWRPFFAEVKYDSYLQEYFFDYGFDVDSELVLDDLLLYNGSTKLYADFLPNYDAVDPDDIISEDDIDDGDKVLVVPVDGKFYVELCESKTVTVDTVSIDADKKDYVKVDGTTYYESGLYWAYYTYDWYGDGPDHNELYWDLSACDTDTDYILYFDSYGNVVAYKEDKGPKGAGKYALVTASYIKDNGVKDDWNYYLELTKGGSSKTSYVEVQWMGTRYPEVDADALPFFVEARPTSVITYLPFQKENWVYDMGWTVSTKLLTGENAFYVDYPGSFWEWYYDSVYDDVLDVWGRYSYGYYTALIRTSYDDDGDVDVKNLDEICDFTRTSNYSVSAAQNRFIGADGTNYYATDDTVFFIYQYDELTGALVDVYSFVGYKNLSAIDFEFTCMTSGDTCAACIAKDPYATIVNSSGETVSAHTCDGDWYATGISAMYGEVEGGGPNKGSINALVIETNTTYTKLSRDYVFIYNVQFVTGSEKNNDLRWYVDYIDADGNTGSMYVEYKHSGDFYTTKKGVIYGMYNRTLCDSWDDDETYDVSNTGYNFNSTLLSITDADYIGSYLVFNGDDGSSEAYYTDADTLFYFNCAVASNNAYVGDNKLAPTTKAALLDKGKDGKAKVSSYYVIWKNDTDSNKNAIKTAVAIIGGYINPIVYNRTDNVYAERYSAAAGYLETKVYTPAFNDGHYEADGVTLAAGHNGTNPATDTCAVNGCNYDKYVRTDIDYGYEWMLDDASYGTKTKGSYEYFCSIVKGASGPPSEIAGTDGPPSEQP